MERRQGKDHCRSLMIGMNHRLNLSAIHAAINKRNKPAARAPPGQQHQRRLITSFHHRRPRRRPGFYGYPLLIVVLLHTTLTQASQQEIVYADRFATPMPTFTSGCGGWPRR